jgi:hypothetical protein
MGRKNSRLRRSSAGAPKSHGSYMMDQVRDGPVRLAPGLAIPFVVTVADVIGTSGNRGTRTIMTRESMGKLT